LRIWAMRMRYAVLGSTAAGRAFQQPSEGTPLEADFVNSRTVYAPHLGALPRATENVAGKRLVNRAISSRADLEADSVDGIATRKRVRQRASKQKEQLAEVIAPETEIQGGGSASNVDP
jgi:hypothetical protein